MINSAAGGLRVGISYADKLPWMSPAQLAQTLDDAVAVGVNWIRADLAWRDVQHDSPAQFSWSGFDQVVAAANARHLSLSPVLAYAPSWARAPGCTTDKCPPSNNAQFAAFVSAAVRRYAPQGIHSWEIWNEPNNGVFWAPGANVSQYLALVQAVAPAIRQADPSATIVSGGLAPKSTGSGNINDLDFVQGFCSAGGTSLVDAIGWHPYTSPVPPTYYAVWNRWSRISATPRSVQSILASCGSPNMKVWATEYGGPTQGPGVMSDVNNYYVGTQPTPDHVSESLQALMATQSVQLAKSSNMIAALFWYASIDTGTDTSQRSEFFGLRRYDGSLKPAYAAYQAAIANARAS